MLSNGSKEVLRGRHEEGEGADAVNEIERHVPDSRGGQRRGADRTRRICLDIEGADHGNGVGDLAGPRVAAILLVGQGPIGRRRRGRTSASHGWETLATVGEQFPTGPVSLSSRLANDPDPNLARAKGR